MGASLRIIGLAKSYGAAQAVASVSLDIAAGEFVSLLGASGSGKTTTLMMVAGFTRPDRGEVLLDGAPITRLPPEKRGIGVVFQNYALFPHMNVMRNVGFPLKMRRVPAATARARVADALARVGLSGFEARLPAQLSGGQQQRVALARALVFEPGLLLMDEPLGALDRALRETMKGEIRRLHRELGITIVYVTHDQEEALTLSDRIVLMDAGNIIQLGRPADLYERPASRFVAGFIGESTLIPGKVVGDGDGVALLPEAGGPKLPARAGSVREGDAAMLLLRPEKTLIAPHSAADGGLPAIVQDVIYVGDISRLTLRLEGGPEITIKQPNRADAFRAEAGMSVRVGWAREDAVLLPA
ncbi:MAG: ABC transporter ATP-binding protein [Acetobacteraceae bacterium]|nr:ABC transporter ATP-binding protein [Acetobacteraceae bacterium]